MAPTVTLELTDLHGDITATVNPASDAAPSATYTYTEFGTTEAASATPSQYGYLGAAQRSQGLGDTLLTGVRGYSTALGRFDGIDPVAGASANAYDYCYQNTLTCTDTTGKFPGWAKNAIIWAVSWFLRPIIASAIDAFFPWASWVSPEIAGCLTGTIATLIWGGGSMRTRIISSAVSCALSIFGSWSVVRQFGERIGERAYGYAYDVQRAWDWLIHGSSSWWSWW